MAVSKVLLITWMYVAIGLTIAKQEEDVHTSLPRGFPRPLNVDPELDCAVKELAWEYAKKLLPQVR
jgi:hypothetical protein